MNIVPYFDTVYKYLLFFFSSIFWENQQWLSRGTNIKIFFYLMYSNYFQFIFIIGLKLKLLFNKWSFNVKSKLNAWNCSNYYHNMKIKQQHVLVITLEQYKCLIKYICEYIINGNPRMEWMWCTANAIEISIKLKLHRGKQFPLLELPTNVQTNLHCSKLNFNILYDRSGESNCKSQITNNSVYQFSIHIKLLCFRDKLLKVSFDKYSPEY